MEDVDKVFPAKVRYAIYIVVAIVVVVAWVLHYITDDQATTILLAVANLLGVSGLVLASINVNRAPANGNDGPVDVGNEAIN